MVRELFVAVMGNEPTLEDENFMTFITPNNSLAIIVEKDAVRALYKTVISPKPEPLSSPRYRNTVEKYIYDRIEPHTTKSYVSIAVGSDVIVFVGETVDERQAENLTESDVKSIKNDAVKKLTSIQKAVNKYFHDALLDDSDGA